jgi:hypothetical protein
MEREAFHHCLFASSLQQTRAGVTQSFSSKAFAQDIIGSHTLGPIGLVLLVRPRSSVIAPVCSAAELSFWVRILPSLASTLHQTRLARWELTRSLPPVLPFNHHTFAPEVFLP